MSIWTDALVEPLAGDWVYGDDQHETYEAVKALTDPYTAYTPTWLSSGTQPALGNGSISGGFRQAGKFGQLHILLTIGSTSTFGTGTYRFSLPSGWSFTSDRCTGINLILDATGNVAIGATFVALTTALSCRIHGLAIASSIPSATIPMTWATGDKWYLTFNGELEP